MLGMSRGAIGAVLVICIGTAMAGEPGVRHPFHAEQAKDAPESVVLAVEMIHDARIIPLDRRPGVSPRIRQWLGVPRGHWEGDTLVVETTHLTGRIRERGATVFGVGEHARIIERFRRVDDRTIDYRYTIDDPTVYTEAWTAAIPLNAVEGPVYEYACHEGNYSLPNMLRGARSAEAQ